ncbi:hypothetical protein HC931_23250 [Candidatus Gracilibacteria bacterium]|nr:hypothetical protein [Candidatus Gracilibacteria bacterium]NJM87742.1 hypothetical protein [Hydrococcus sp. RU_2_2]NJP20859.1 hypothetical protein [Hydrococcus sp. CRU_1_1]
MLSKVSEKRMHQIRWVLTVGWLILIFSLFYDPISSVLTEPNNLSSPVRLRPEIFLDPEKCVKVQGECLSEQAYSLGARLWWAVIVPIAIFILLVFGHEFWRRICPLSFLSQIPRALGLQRKRKVVDSLTGRTRYELVTIGENSWLGRNHLFLQFGLFVLGLIARILFVNSDRTALGIFLVFTILSAIFVGYLYAGKSWCNYFCPMAPVQMVYNGPRGLFGSQAHQQQKPSVTQSMCRFIDSTGQEKSACVACKAPCIDIDAEKTYWEELKKPGRKLVQYGYLGMVYAFYFYYFLYAGNWDYYFSGAWTHEESQLATVFSPGFYLFDRAIPIPKLFAVPLTFAFFVGFAYLIGVKLEKAYRFYRHRKDRRVSSQQAQHVIFTLCTVVSFWIFFSFGARPNLNLIPTSVLLGFNGLIVLVSSLWLYQTLGRTSEQYSRESLATSLQKQLKKLDIDFSHFLEGRSLEDLNPDELYALAKVLPGFTHQNRLQIYTGVLKDALEQRSVTPIGSLTVFQALREELGIRDREHQEIIDKLCLDNSDLIAPHLRQISDSEMTIRRTGSISKAELTRIFSSKSKK